MNSGGCSEFSGIECCPDWWIVWLYSVQSVSNTVTVLSHQETTPQLIREYFLYIYDEDIKLTLSWSSSSITVRISHIPLDNGCWPMRLWLRKLSVTKHGNISVWSHSNISGEQQTGDCHGFSPEPSISHFNINCEHLSLIIGHWSGQVRSGQVTDINKTKLLKIVLHC